MQQQPAAHISARQQYGAYASGEEERVITDEMMEVARSRIGAELPSRDGFYTQATRDAIRHYAHGIGDDNPLWCDPEYAKKTRWGGIIAPPNFPTAVAVPKVRTPEERERARDPMSGIHAWAAGGTMHFYRPIYLGDVLTSQNFNGDYVEKKNSSFAGRIVLDYNNSERWNQRNELVERSTGYSIRGGRQRQWGERQKYSDIQPQTYPPERIARIDADYEREAASRRGATPRYWEDVRVGEELTPVVKGPITVTDIMAYIVGTGILMYRDNFAHRLAYETRKAHPRLFEMNDAGIPDMIEAVHWDNGLAQRTGNPLAYDYGPQRTTWIIHGITNWIGDEGWLKSMDSEIRRFVYIGDTVWIKGRVTRKEIRNGEAIVYLDMWAEDQRGRNTMPAHAEVLLPSRQLGPVHLPPKFDSPPPGWYGK